jgi:DNA-binding response OmpR family regulator
MEKAGFSVATAVHGLDALAQLKEQPFALMILDMQMPDLDGLAVMEQTYQLQPDLQIIVLTGNPTIDNAIASIKANVADYFVKPIDLFTLVAAVSRAVENRSLSQQQRVLVERLDSVVQQLNKPTDTYSTRNEQGLATGAASLDKVSVPPVTLDKSQRLLTLNHDLGEPLKLSRGETAVLHTLMHHTPRVLSCAQIVHHAFGYTTNSASEAENVIRPYISRLRQKVETDARNPHFLQTVHGRGYRFVSPEHSD